jgi:hypothetical protein
LTNFRGFFFLRVVRVEIPTGGQAMAVELSSLGELVGFVVGHLINASTEAYRLSFLPHLELSNLAKSGDFWSIIQVLKRTCLSSNRVPRIVIESATVAVVAPQADESVSTYNMSNIESYFSMPTVSGSDLDDFLATLEPQLCVSTSDLMPDPMATIQPTYGSPSSEIPPTPTLNFGYRRNSYIDPSALFLGAIPAPTMDFISTEEPPEPPVDPHVSLNTNSSGPLKRRGSLAFTEQILKFQSRSEQTSGTSPYSRPPPPFARSVECASIGSHVAQSKAVVTDASQISTAWFNGHPYVPLYISTAFVIGGGSTPTDARRWLNRAPSEFQPNDDDLLPPKVAGALPRVRYVKWSFVQRLFLSSGLESSVPKEKLQFLEDKMKRYEILYTYVMNDGTQHESKCNIELLPSSSAQHQQASEIHSC